MCTIINKNNLDGGSTHPILAASLFMTPLLLILSDDEVKLSSADSPRSTLGGGAGPGARGFLPGMGGMGGGTPLKGVG